jgi:hypothetical protein
LILRGFLSLVASSVSIEQDEESSVLKNDGSEYLFKHAPAPATSNLNHQKENCHEQREGFKVPKFGKFLYINYHGYVS